MDRVREWGQGIVPLSSIRLCPLSAFCWVNLSEQHSLAHPLWVLLGAYHGANGAYGVRAGYPESLGVLGSPWESYVYIIINYLQIRSLLPQVLPLGHSWAAGGGLCCL
jgi:hypothetical protein